MAATALVIENNPKQGIGRAGDWLTEVGLDLETLRPHAGDLIPRTVGGYDSLIALGGGRGVEWSEELGALMETAVADGTPLFAICSSARQLGENLGGELEDTKVAEARMLGKRDAAGRDPVFGPAPLTIDVVAWRRQELVRLPEDATLLAASPHGSQDVFRIGDHAWASQSHFELDPDQLAELGGFEPDALDKAASVDTHIVETWKPIIQRFGRLVTGRRKPLDLIDG
ncbi:type 1 glutamine amidotransferase [Haloglycomyces albus]|uniref:type 1 glutamine amidotransferase n=1 Tax=Haloglycomyces albus TaxID=526067 RepID=UPI00146FA7E8|nr:type 1 glutamine amidotransferase [Haloglycomyces albus]